MVIAKQWAKFLDLEKILGLLGCSKLTLYPKIEVSMGFPELTQLSAVSSPLNQHNHCSSAFLFSTD